MSWISGAYDVIIHGPYLKQTQLLFVIWRHRLWTACPCLSLSAVISIGVSSSTEHEFALARVQIWTSVRSIEIFGIWPQASKQASKQADIHMHVQCNHASVGLAQARPNSNVVLFGVGTPQLDQMIAWTLLPVDSATMLANVPCIIVQLTHF